MKRHTYRFSASAIGLVATLSGSSLAAPPERTLVVDPIELVAGREVPGKPELSIEHEGMEYRFATTESRSEFLKNPAKYEVADGGACGSMGALAGIGDARRYAVHDGRYWFFASDGCKATFLKDPASRIEKDDEIPTGTAQQIASGRASLDRLVAWAGGVEKLKSLRSYRATSSKTETVSDKLQVETHEISIEFPERYYTRDAWNEHWYSTIRNADSAAMASARNHETIAKSRRTAFNRTMARVPIVILKSYVENNGLVVVGDGEGMVGETSVEFVKVSLHNATSRLAIEKSTGRLVQLAFHGRDATSAIGDSVRTFTKYSSVDGITLPTAYTVNFSGKEIAAAGVAFDAFETNPVLSADLFKTTK